MILHLVSLETEESINQYYTIREELSQYAKELEDKEEWIIFTKMDLTNQDYIDRVVSDVDKLEKRVFVISTETGDGVKELRMRLLST
ncbi:MAG: hypothetical protein R3B53_01865 [Candidatus Paceibacterota bacterium]